MKKYKPVILLVIIFATFLVYPLYSNSTQYIEEDNYGKVIIQLVNPVTEEPVTESFLVFIYDSTNENFPVNLYRREQTNNQGKLELEMIPYTYYLQFFPEDLNSRYRQTPYPFCIKENERYTIKVETGKITYFKVKAGIGGILKVYLADMNNVRFNPQEKFSQKFEIKSIVSGEICETIDDGRDSLDDGELIVYRLFTGEYCIDIEFDGLGFERVIKKDIWVEEGKTTDVVINLDLNDSTGVEGFLTDAAGVPVYNSDICFGAIDVIPEDTIGFCAYTNKKGYYILKGMPEGKYFVTYGYKRKTNKGGFSCIYGYVDIKKDVFLHLDIQFKETISEMEKD